MTQNAHPRVTAQLGGGGLWISRYGAYLLIVEPSINQAKTEQRASQSIDTSFGPNAIAGIYLGVAHWDTHGLPWQHVFTSTAHGGTHYAVHYNIHVNPELYPLIMKALSTHYEGSTKALLRLY